MSDLSVRELCKVFRTRSEEMMILDRVSLSMDRGQNVAVVGPSGAGKSTLLQILGVLDQPSDGTVEIDGQNPFGMDETKQAHFRNEKIGFIFQDHHLLPQWNVLENTLLPSLAFGKPNQELRNRAEELIRRVGLEKRIRHLPSQLSGGERGRVAVARALLMQPLLVLADEPTGNLDAESADAVSDLLLEVPKEQNAILIVVTHSMALAGKMQQCLELRKGKLTPKVV